MEEVRLSRETVEALRRMWAPGYESPWSRSGRLLEALDADLARAAEAAPKTIPPPSSSTDRVLPVPVEGEDSESGCPLCGGDGYQYVDQGNASSGSMHPICSCAAGQRIRDRMLPKVATPPAPQRTGLSGSATATELLLGSGTVQDVRVGEVTQCGKCGKTSDCVKLPSGYLCNECLCQSAGDQIDESERVTVEVIEARCGNCARWTPYPNDSQTGLCRWWSGTRWMETQMSSVEGCKQFDLRGRDLRGPEDLGHEDARMPREQPPPDAWDATMLEEADNPEPEPEPKQPTEPEPGCGWCERYSKLCYMLRDNSGRVLTVEPGEEFWDIKFVDASPSAVAELERALDKCRQKSSRRKAAIKGLNACIERLRAEHLRFGEFLESGLDTGMVLVSGENGTWKWRPHTEQPPAGGTEEGDDHGTRRERLPEDVTLDSSASAGEAEPGPPFVIRDLGDLQRATSWVAGKLRSIADGDEKSGASEPEPEGECPHYCQGDACVALGGVRTCGKPKEQRVTCLGHASTSNGKWLREELEACRICLNRARNERDEANATIDRLRARVAELEKRPSDTCPICNGSRVVGPDNPVANWGADGEIPCPACATEPVEECRYIGFRSDEGRHACGWIESRFSDSGVCFDCLFPGADDLQARSDCPLKHQVDASVLAAERARLRELAEHRLRHCDELNARCARLREEAVIARTKSEKLRERAERAERKVASLCESCAILRERAEQITASAKAVGRKAEAAEQRAEVAEATVATRDRELQTAQGYASEYRQKWERSEERLMGCFELPEPNTGDGFMPVPRERWADYWKLFLGAIAVPGCQSLAAAIERGPLGGEGKWVPREVVPKAFSMALAGGCTEAFVEVLGFDRDWLHAQPETQEEA